MDNLLHLIPNYDQNEQYIIFTFQNGKYILNIHTNGKNNDFIRNKINEAMGMNQMKYICVYDNRCTELKTMNMLEPYTEFMLNEYKKLYMNFYNHLNALLVEKLKEYS